MEETPNETSPPAAGLKVVLAIKEGYTNLWLQQAETDPLLFRVDETDVHQVLARVPDVLEQARARWREQPRLPAYQPPASTTGFTRENAQRPARRTTAPTTGQPAAATPPAAQRQPADRQLTMF